MRTCSADLDNCLDDMLAAYEWLARCGADDAADWPLLLSGEPPNRSHVRGVARALYILQVEWQQVLYQRVMGIGD